MIKQKQLETAESVNIIPFFDSNGKKIDTLELDKERYNGEFNEPLLYQAILMYRANSRSGTAKTKKRGEISGGGKKPWRQKGTGRARAGSIRSPLWRHGGTIFGPQKRDFSYGLPKKLKRMAFISSINAKLKSGEILGVEGFSLEKPKTKLIADILKKMKIQKSVLLLTDKIDNDLLLSCRNIKRLKLRNIAEATAFDVLSCDYVILTKKSIELLNAKGNSK